MSIEELVRANFAAFNDKVTASRTYYDAVTFARQLGMMQRRDA